MDNEPKKKTVIKDIHPDDAFHDVKGCLIGKQVEIMRILQSESIPKGFISGGFQFQEPVPEMTFSIGDYCFFHAVQIEEVEDEHVPS